MTPDQVLTVAPLEPIRGRAAGYDQENSFFTEDLEELAAAGLPQDLCAGVRRRTGAWPCSGRSAAKGSLRRGGSGHRARDQHAPGLDGRGASPRRTR